MALMERTESATVASILAARATRDANRAFVLGPRGSLSFGQAEAQAEALAAGLSHLGVEAGDRIALVLPACPEFVVSMLAAAKLGAVIVPLDPRLTPAELQYMLRHSQAVCAVTVEEEHGVDYLALFEELMPGLPELQYLVTVGEEDLWYDDRIFQFEDLLSAGSGRDYPAAPVDPEGDRFAIVYTSGTTGKPKGVELTHRNLISVAAATAAALELSSSDRIVGVSALFHVFGLGPGVLSSLVSGAGLILSEGADPAALLDLARELEATVHYGVPTVFVQALQELDRRGEGGAGPLRLAVVAGAPVGDELLKRIEERMAPVAVAAYSLTEASSTVCVGRPGDPPGKRGFTVGRPLEGTRIRILDPGGADLPEESVGEIAVRGPGVMLGYYRQPALSRSTFTEDGFLRTGDLGILDEEGYLHLVGRSKDVIIRSGFNVYPREVESRLESHPAVEEVVVVGVPDPLLGEAICACVIPVEGAIVTERELVDWCRETLSDTKLPDRVRFVDDFPRTGMGKPRRAELARAMRSEAPPA